jgi:uncharacterized SAM-binding protein YcdF (DUF218 family)
MVVLKAFFGLIINLDILLMGILLIELLLMLCGKKFRRRFIVIALLPLLLIEFSPLGRSVIACLENRFPQPKSLPADVTGFILLGGSFALPETADRDFPVHSLAGSRLYEFIALVKQHPNARVVFTGNELEAKFTKQIFLQFGVEEHRISIEGESKTTQDNVRLTMAAIKPKPEEKWVVVTSAFHMPRSVGLFRGVGWEVIPYSVDYHTSGKITLKTWMTGLVDRLNAVAWQQGMLQWAGMINHYLEGQSPELYPKPLQE